MNEIETCQIAELSPYSETGELNIPNIKKAMERLISLGVREKVIVHCTRVGMLLDRNDGFVAVPSFELPADYIKGSVGAGDAFAAGCLYGLYKGYDDRRLLEYASAAAVCNLSEADSVSGMKRREDIEKLGNLFCRCKLPE